MKSLFAIIIAALAMASCHPSTLTVETKPEVVKARLHEVNGTDGITLRYIDTAYHVGDTARLYCQDGSFHYFAILSK